MEFGELKPVLSALVLPPAGPLLLALLGLVLVALRRRAAGAVVAFAGIASLWFLSCNAVAVALAQSVLPQVQPITREQLQSVQAIVVLSGGSQPEAPEYGAAQLTPYSYQRLRYGALLARQSGKPVAYSGGAGWGSAGVPVEAEGAIARRVLQADYGITVRWLDDRSRDTRENAQRTAELLLPAGVKRIALVTDSWHMPRSERNFRAAGFDVVPAPTGFPSAGGRPLLQWIPSEDGLALTRHVLREWLGLRLT